MKRLLAYGFSMFALVGCQTTGTNTASESAASATADFAEMQAAMGASVFADACIKTLPDFSGAEGVLNRLGASMQDGVWSLGNGAAVFSVQSSGQRKGCVATIQATKPYLVASALGKELNDPALMLRPGKLNGNIAFAFKSKAGPAAIVFAPFASGSTATTFWVEILPTN